MTAFGKVIQERDELGKELAGLQTRMKKNEESPEFRVLQGWKKSKLLSPKSKR